jgi:hypothetical protein
MRQQRPRATCVRQNACCSRVFRDTDFGTPVCDKRGSRVSVEPPSNVAADPVSNIAIVVIGDSMSTDVVFGNALYVQLIGESDAT